MTTSAPTVAPALNEAVVRDILRAICRLATQRGQLVLYRLAVESPEKGFMSDEVADRLGFDQAQHRGLMSALAGRINETPRETSLGQKPGLSLMFRQKWEGKQYHYWPRPELLEAIRRLPPLTALMAKPFEDVLASPKLALALPEGVEPNPAPPTPAPPSVTPFRKFLAKLDGEGLVFAPDVIANLLLALQVKRFVILTGISGTGKTRIGQALAASIRGTQRVPLVADVNDRTLATVAMPYMREKNQMVLPVALASQMEVEKGAGHILARWPTGQMDLTTAFLRRTFYIFFKGAFKAWFNETFPEGAPFVVRLEEAVDGKPSALVFGPPEKIQEVLVENSEVVAVRPDWTDHRGLLGHYNPLTDDYVSTPFLRLLLRAQDEHQRAAAEKRSATPFFAMLDEMNLARVEHYFVDFLSALESGEALHLHDIAAIEEGEGAEGGTPVPRKLKIPPNLFFLGTVNVDETTHFFSPKVLDRTFAIELDQVNLDELTAASATPGDLELSRWNGGLPPARPLDRDDWKWFAAHRGGELADAVKAVHGLLAEHHRHFGYRVAEEIARFVRIAVAQVAEADAEVAAWVALDLAILQKVLVKLNGTQAELEKPLFALLDYTLTGETNDPGLKTLSLWKLRPTEGKVTAADEGSDIAPLLPRSAAKLWRMRERLQSQGFTAWIE